MFQAAIKAGFAAAALALGCGGAFAEDAMAGDTIYEFRNYTLKPGQREVLTELFEREFIAPQNEAGAHVVAVFRDLDRPDRFVWMRSFADMGSRRSALETFYYGPVWRAHREAANDTMIDSDDVHLLRPSGGAPAWPDSDGADAPVYTVHTYALDGMEEASLRTRIEDDPHLVGTFATHDAENTFPALPVREEHVFLVLRRFGSEAEVSEPEGMPEPVRTFRLAPTTASPQR